MMPNTACSGRQAGCAFLMDNWLCLPPLTLTVGRANRLRIEHMLKQLIRAGLIGAGLEIAFSLPSYSRILVPHDLRPAFEAISCFASLLYVVALPAAGLIIAISLPNPTTRADALRWGAVAGLIASALDHLFTVVLRITLWSGGSMKLVSTDYGSLTHELLTSMTCGSASILAGTTLSALACMATLTYLRKIPSPVGEPSNSP